MTRQQQKAMFAKMGNRNVQVTATGFRRIRVTKDTKIEDVNKFLQDKKARIRFAEKIKESKKFKNLNTAQKKRVKIILTDFEKVNSKQKLIKFVKKHPEVLTAALMAGGASTIGLSTVVPTILLMPFLAGFSLGAIASGVVTLDKFTGKKLFG